MTLRRAIFPLLSAKTPKVEGGSRLPGLESAVVVGPLRVPGFARLAGSYTINELGDNLGIVALAVLVLDRTGCALSVAGLFVAWKFVPACLAPALAARLARQPVARALPALYALEALPF